MKLFTSTALGISATLTLTFQSAMAYSQAVDITIPSYTGNEFAQLEEQPKSSQVIIDGKLYQLTGDMLEPVQEDSGQVSIMSAVEISANKWPDGIIYYDFYDSVTEENQQRFIDATKVWEEIADLQFLRRTDQSDYVHVRNGTENRSMVGKTGGGQFFSMNNWDTKYIIVHELGHVIGMRHEHQRSDRDEYVEIIEDNIKPEYVHNFDIRQTHNYSNYDFLSVMHYPSRAFSVNGQETIIPKSGYEHFSRIMAQRIDLGGGDQVAAASHYGVVNINIPDPAFKSYLTSYFDTNNDGEIDSLEAANIEEIRTPGNGEIQSLQGIHVFRYLKHLTAVNENLTELPELPKRLETLNIAGNYLDTAQFEWVMDRHFLTAIDVTDNLLDVYSCEALELIDSYLNEGSISFSPAKGGNSLVCDEEAELTLIPSKTRENLSSKGEKVFHIDVPENAQTLTVITDNSGDELGGEMNMYVAYNRQPTTTDFDFSSENGGNIESIEVTSPETGRWYILLSPIERSFEGVNLTATVTLADQSDNILVNQKPVSGLNASAGESLFYTITVPENASDLSFEITGGSGDADLYIRFASRPTESVYDYRPYLGGNEESVAIANPTPGIWHVMLHGYTDFDQVSLTGSFTESSTDEFLIPGEVISDLNGHAGDQLEFKIEVPEGATQLSVATGAALFNSVGDADLYIKHGEPATESNADYASENWGNYESIDLNAPQSGTWYITIYGYTDFENVWISADY
ncbi:pre-peptidase C-terminal domain-containing protein [Microbulbifer sp. ZKSA004]|uniref:pre-peptidase C-terminal domain-containing protein n=1 Tax=Microbulbifer sp. ZKSA004 TaxID=3243389 RepID=UPI00403922A1